jgi:hypothetical protein
MRTNEQMQNDQRRASARNAVLSDTQNRLAVMRDKNYAAVDQNTAGYAAPAQASATANKVATREAMIDASADAAAAAGQPIVSGEAPSVVKDEFSKRVGNAIAQSRANAKAGAAISGIGDTWQQNASNNANTAGTVDMNNNFARGQAAILPSLQDYADYSAQKVPSILGQVLPILGTGLSGLSGSLPQKKSIQRVSPASRNGF